MGITLFASRPANLTRGDTPSLIKTGVRKRAGLKAATQEPRVYLRRWAEFGLAGTTSDVQASDAVPNR